MVESRQEEGVEARGEKGSVAVGREALVIKQRECRTCERLLYANSWGLRQHAELCKRAKASGLILPGVERPDIRIIGA